MGTTISLPDEDRLVDAFHQYGVLDALTEKGLEELTGLAAQICESPYALISLMDPDRQWFFARVGLTAPEPPREESFCIHVLRAPDLLIVPDAKLDPRFVGNSLVTGEAGVRFYAGAALRMPNGEAVGSLCVMDRVPRVLSPVQVQTLRVLGRQVMTQLELRRHSRELQESETRMRSYIENNPALVWTVDEEGRFHSANPTFCRAFGKTESELVGRLLADVFEPEFVKEYMAGNRIVLEKRGVLQTVDPGRRADGSVGQFLAVKFPMESGSRLLLGGMAIDVTEREGMEQALRTSEMRFSSIFRANPAGIGITVLRTGLVLDANEQLCAFFGRKREELVGKRVSELGRWVDEAQRVPLIAEVERTGSVREAVVQMYGKGGEVRDVSLSLERMDLPGEEEALLITMFLDVTERKRLEKVREVSEERLLQLFLRCPVGVSIHRWSDQTFVDVNAAFSKLTGWSREEAIGRTTPQLGLIGEAELARMQTHLQERGVLPEFDLEMHRADGEVRWVLVATEFVMLRGAEHLISTLIDITDRKRTEEALRRSETRFAAIFQGCPAAIALSSVATGLLIDVNERLCEFFGWPREEAVGKTSEELGVWIDVGQRAQLIEQLMVAGAVRSAEVPMRRRDGEIRDLLLSMELLKLEGEAGPILVTMFLDLTERRRAEAQLRLLETCVSRLNDMVVITEAEPQVEPGPRILFVNEAFTRHTGYTAEETLGRSPRFLQGPKTDRAQLDKMAQAMREWRPVRVELINYKKNGEEFWVELDLVPVADAAGWFTHWVAVERDVTRRRKIEEAIRQSEDRYRMLFEQAPDGIVIANAEGFYLDANASTCRMLGYTHEEFVGLHSSAVIAPADVARIEPARREIRSGVAHHEEWSLQRKDGSTFRVEIIAAAMPDGNLLAMIRDVTERKRQDERFRRLVDSNAQGVAFWNKCGKILDSNDAFLEITGYTRTDLEDGRINWVAMTPAEYTDVDERAMAEIDLGGVCAPFEKEYIRKDGSRVPVLLGAATFDDDPEEGVCFVLDLTDQKKLERQSLRAQRMDSIGTLAGGIAHDLNNMLGPIVMSVDLLQLRCSDATSLELVSTIRSSAQRGVDMVRQVLSFARGVEGRKAEVQVSRVIRDIEKIANDTFLKHIQVHTVIPPDLWTVIGDDTQIHQVLLNLGVNARDAMPGGGLLTMTAQNLTLDAHYAAMDGEAQAGRYVLVRVCDTGMGMSAAVLEKIFDPFFTTKEVERSTGLGLSTSLAIVKSHGGFMRVESSPRKGATFEVYLPAQTETGPADAPEPVTELPRGKGQLVLVIDDESSMRQITKQTLEAYGYQVVVASDGMEAVTIFAKDVQAFSIVITDINMPGLDGPATIQVLWKLNPDLPVIAASGLTTSSQVARVTNIGVRHFLAKPFTAETLLRMLDEVLRAET